MRGMKVFAGAAASALLLALLGPVPALADTIEAALVRAYQTNPQLNAQRAQVRFTDENVPQALSGYRPKVAVTASAGFQYTDTLTTAGGTATAIVRTRFTAPMRRAAPASRSRRHCSTANRPPTRLVRRRARCRRRAKRYACSSRLCCYRPPRIYMDFLRDSAIVEVQKSNVRVLEQTLKQTEDRFNVGEVTRTDVAQSEAQLAAGKTQQLTAESNLITTQANFRRIIGSEPVALAPGSPVDRYPAANAGVRRRTRADRESERHVRDVRHRRQLSSGQGGGRRAVPDRDAAGFGAADYEQTLTIQRSFGGLRSRRCRCRSTRAAPNIR